MTCEKTIRDVLEEAFAEYDNPKKQPKEPKPFEVIETDQTDKDLADFFREQGLL